MRRFSMAFAGVVASWGGIAAACSPPYVEEHRLDSSEQAINTRPPSAARIVSAQVYRHDAAPGGCDSCGSYANLNITIEVANGDRTKWEEMGYLIEVVRQQPSGAIRVPGALRAGSARSTRAMPDASLVPFQ